MGHKFTSLHIINSNTEQVGYRLAQCQLVSDKRDLERLKEIPNDPELSGVINLLAKMKKLKPLEAAFYVIDNNGNISVFSEYLISQTLKEKLMQLFAGFDKYVLSVDYFDDDFLEMLVFKKYKVKTSLVIGENLDEYALKPAKFDANILCEIFNIQPDSIENAYDPEDIFVTCTNFAELFQLPLTLKTTDAINSKKFNVEEFIFEI